MSLTVIVCLTVTERLGATSVYDMVTFVLPTGSAFMWMGGRSSPAV